MGGGRSEYIRKYNPFLFHLDYMIDEKIELQGKVICGKKIYGKDVLYDFADKKVCIVVFPNIEKQVELEARKILDNFDIIVSRLIQNKQISETSYSQAGEDILFLQTIRHLGIKNPIYMDIGVCHPVIRNNTYLLYSKGYTNGILVEPNPDMCELIKIYRPENTLLNIGACATAASSLPYYVSSNPSIVGHNTFVKAQADRMGFTKHIDIPVKNINDILDKCNQIPDILDIDTEGLDKELIEALDTQKYRIKIICIETCVCGEDGIEKILMEKGYSHFASTDVNSIFIANELLVSTSQPSA